MYNHGIYRLTLYKTSNYGYYKIYLLQHVINNLHNIQIKATVNGLLKVAIYMS